MAKKKNSRKALAVALGIMGIAGLSVASASQLTITPSNEVAMGTSAVFASCDSAVGIKYGYDATAHTINSVTITGISSTCNGQAYSFSIADLESGATPLTGSGTLTFGTATGDQSVTVTPAPTTVSIADDLGAATVIIG